MPGTSTWIRLIFDLGAAQGVFLALMLLASRQNRRANHLLAALAMAMAVGIFIPRRLSGALAGLPAHAVNFMDVSPYLFGPLLYLYVRQLTRQNFLWRWHWLHFLPFLSSFRILFPFYLSSPTEQYDMVKMGLANPMDVRLAYLLLVSQFGHILIYTAISLRWLRQFDRGLHDRFSNLDRINLAWLTRLCRGFALLLCLIIVLSLLGLSGIKLGTPLNHFYSLGLATFLYMLAFFALRQQQLLFPVRHSPEETKKTGKYQAASLPESDLQRYKQRLLGIMEKDKPHLQNDLGLVDLANISKIPEHHLSQVLNERLEQNFYNFINSYRVGVARRLLTEPANDHLTVLEIAFRSGFNNKVSFNKSFKERTGLTPSVFRRQQKQTASIK